MGYKSATTNKIGSNSIKAICKDSEGTLWLGTANDGIYGIKGKNKPSLHFEHKKNSNSVPSTIHHIHQTADGRLWLASPLEGLAEMDPKTGLCRYYKLQDHHQNEVKFIVGTSRHPKPSYVPIYNLLLRVYSKEATQRLWSTL